MIFIKRHLSDSHKQLKADFGEFPLRCFASKPEGAIEFYIVKTSALNSKIYDWLSINRCLKQGDLAWHTQLEEQRAHILQQKQKISELKSGIYEGFQPVLKLVTAEKNLFLRYFNAIILLLFAVCVLPFFGVYVLYSITRVIVKIVPILFKTKTASRNTAGHFIPVTYCGKTEIVVKRPLMPGRGNCYHDGIVSHEHIHMLQHQHFADSPSRRPSAFLTDKKQALVNILMEPEKHFVHHSYFLQMNEMEARLHEIVLSHYRANHSLPLSFDEYIQMLLGADAELGVIVSGALKDHVSTSTDGLSRYAVRCEQLQIEVAISIALLKDKDTRRKYIMEAMSVMYANLLALYGYVNESRAFTNTIKCKDMYNELYGLQDGLQDGLLDCPEYQAA